MPQAVINISVKNLAKMIHAMNTQELETLSVLLMKEEKELIKRKKEIEQKTIQLLTREEVFDV